MSLQYEADGEGIFFSALFCCNFFKKKRWFGLNSECSSTVLLVKRLVGRSWTLSAASAHLVIWLMMRKAGLPQPLLHHQLKKKNVQRYCCISCYFLMITVSYFIWNTLYMYENCVCIWSILYDACSPEYSINECKNVFCNP